MGQLGGARPNGPRQGRVGLGFRQGSRALLQDRSVAWPGGGSVSGMRAQPAAT